MNNQSSTAAWASVKGTLVHRCVLAPAGKWLSIGRASKPRPGDVTRTPNLISEAGWMAQQLGDALATGDDEMAYALIDVGGPNWVEEFDNFHDLKPRDQKRVLRGLKRLTVGTAEILLRQARSDRWEAMRTEVTDPFERLGAESYAKAKERNWRIDLLANRGRRRPVVLDLKFGRSMRDAEAEVQRIAAKYGRKVADIHDGPVDCRALVLDFNGNHRWSSVKTRWPSRSKR